MKQAIEILRHIEELYHGDTTDEEMRIFAEQNSVRVEAWEKAFEGFYLRDVLDAIDVHYVKKSRTRPNIAQIKAIMNVAGIHAEQEMAKAKSEKNEPDYDTRYQQLDKENGDMNWLVPHYSEVWRRIKADYYPFVANIYHPTHEEFRECMRRWCVEKYGRPYFCESDNDIKNMTPEERRQLEQQALATIRQGFPVLLDGSLRR